MKNYILKEGLIDNSVVTLKRLLNAHPQIDTANLDSNSVFNSAATSSLFNFQKLKGMSPTGIMTRSSQSLKIK